MQFRNNDLRRHGFVIHEELLDRNGQRFRGGLVLKAVRLVDHSTLGLRVMKNKRNSSEMRERACVKPAIVIILRDYDLEWRVRGV